jgi:DNA-binding transcriptional LysR family regulator
MDTLDRLRLFQAVAEAGSFTGAARRFDTSRAQVSKVIRQLEASLATRLFARSTRKVTLTEAGQVLHDRLARPLADLNEALSQARGGPGGVLRINSALSFGQLHLVPALSDFLRLYPQMRVDLTLDDARADLVAGGFDVAIRIGELPDSTLVSRPLASTRLIVCAAPRYLERAGIPGRPEALADHNCLTYGLSADPGHWRFREDDRSFAVRVAGCARLNNGEALAAMAEAGHGITLLPDFIVGPRLAAGSLAAILTEYPSPTLPIQAVYPGQRFVPRKVTALVDFLSERFRRREGWLV